MSKKKMSKAEQEALHNQQEEEERLILEAEVKKLEDLRLQKEEEVRRTMAAQIDFRGLEIEQLKKEAGEGKVQEVFIAKMLAEEDAKDVADREWKKHVDCSSLPDASSEADVNTYISINEENLVIIFNLLFSSQSQLTTHFNRQPQTSLKCWKNAPLLSQWPVKCARSWPITRVWVTRKGGQDVTRCCGG